MNLQQQSNTPVRTRLIALCSQLRSIELALAGLSLDVEQDGVAADIRTLSFSLREVLVQLNTLRQLPEHHGEVVH
jgi:hypothetical protein